VRARGKRLRIIFTYYRASANKSAAHRGAGAWLTCGGDVRGPPRGGPLPGTSARREILHARANAQASIGVVHARRCVYTVSGATVVKA